MTRITTIAAAAAATVVAAAAAPLIAPPAVAAPSARSPKSRVVKSALLHSVRVEVVTGTKVVRHASGVVVASDPAAGKSWVLTNAHVVQREGLSSAPVFRAVIERPKLERVGARLVAAGRAPDEDLALLEIEAVLPAASIADPELADVGSDVVVIGAPFGRALSVSSGIVSQLEVDTEGARPLQRSMKTDAPIGYGSSGGGVFDVPSGKLVGLVEGYRTARIAFGGLSDDEYSFDLPMPGETFLAPPGKIRGFLARAGFARRVGIPETAALESDPKLGVVAARSEAPGSGGASSPAGGPEVPGRAPDHGASAAK